MYLKMLTVCFRRSAFNLSNEMLDEKEFGELRKSTVCML
jgi:hypothetical protein